ncbi:hypothetical protein HUJ04_009215 [Dendroctonus ponderosae]|nr:hypothetical protein HUJ04_009215 [Dendroctonus ponderosae]
MEDTFYTRPSVPGGSNVRDQGGGENRIGAESAKNPRKRPGYQRRQLMHIASCNVQTLSEAKPLEMEEEPNNIKCDIVGVSEVKRRGKDQITLRSGHKFPFKGEEDSPYGGVDFFVHKKHISNLEKIECVAQSYVFDKEIEDFYESVRISLQTTQTHFAVIIGDFDAKQGFKQDNAETALGNFGYGERNERGERLLDFLHQEDVFPINSFFKKMIRAKKCFNVKKERTEIILKNKSKEWKSPERIAECQQVVTRNFEAQDYMEETDIEEMNKNIVNAIKEAEKECYTVFKNRNNKFSLNTRNLLDERRKLKQKYDKNFALLKHINKEIQLDVGSTVPRCMEKNERDLRSAVDTRWLTDDDDDDDDDDDNDDDDDSGKVNNEKIKYALPRPQTWTLGAHRGLSRTGPPRKGFSQNPNPNPNNNNKTTKTTTSTPTLPPQQHQRYYYTHTLSVGAPTTSRIQLALEWEKVNDNNRDVIIKREKDFLIKTHEKSKTTQPLQLLIERGLLTSYKMLHSNTTTTQVTNRPISPSYSVMATRVDLEISDEQTTNAHSRYMWPVWPVQLPDHIKRYHVRSLSQLSVQHVMLRTMQHGACDALRGRLANRRHS